MPKPATQPLRFHVCLDAAEKDMLEALAAQSGMPQGLILRQALRARYAMQLQSTPTCADGGRCQCPQLHART